MMRNPSALGYTLSTRCLTNFAKSLLVLLDVTLVVRFPALNSTAMKMFAVPCLTYS